MLGLLLLHSLWWDIEQFVIFFYLFSCDVFLSPLHIRLRALLSPLRYHYAKFTYDSSLFIAIVFLLLFGPLNTLCAQTASVDAWIHHLIVLLKFDKAFSLHHRVPQFSHRAIYEVFRPIIFYKPGLLHLVTFDIDLCLPFSFSNYRMVGKTELGWRVPYLYYDFSWKLHANQAYKDFECMDHDPRLLASLYIYWFCCGLDVSNVLSGTMPGKDYSTCKLAVDS